MSKKNNYKKYHKKIQVKIAIKHKVARTKHNKSNTRLFGKKLQKFTERH